MCNKPELPFDLRMFEREAKVRGLYLTVSCDFERVLSDIAAKCAIEENSQPLRDGFRIKLPFEMGAKLDKCIEILKAYNEGYYNQYKEQFDVIKELSIYRTMLAHGFSHYDEAKQDDTTLYFTWIEVIDDENGKKLRRLRRDTITFQPFVLRMLHYKEHILTLVDLVLKLREERGNE